MWHVIQPSLQSISRTLSTSPSNRPPIRQQFINKFWLILPNCLLKDMQIVLDTRNTVKCCKYPRMSRANCRSPYFSKFCILYFPITYFQNCTHYSFFTQLWKQSNSLLETKQEIKLWPCFLGFWRHVWEKSRIEWREVR